MSRDDNDQTDHVRVRSAVVSKVAALRPQLQRAYPGIAWSKVDLLSHVMAKGIDAVIAELQEQGA